VGGGGTDDPRPFGVQVNSIICAKNKSGENPEKKTRSRALK
jgi:hypothetical protein